MKKYIGLLLILLTVGYLVISKNTPAPAQTITPAPTEAPTPTKITSDAINIEAGSFYYKPNLFRVKKGDTVKITLNSVSMVHDFNIDELNVHSPMTKSGSSSSIEFIAEKVGEFEFYCSVGQHRKNGQVGKLIVTE